MTMGCDFRSILLILRGGLPSWILSNAHGPFQQFFIKQIDTVSSMFLLLLRIVLSIAMLASD